MKFYVSSGNMKVVISHAEIQSPLDAACEACLNHFNSHTEADPYIRVSETGFTKRKTDKIYDTRKVLKRAGFQFE